MARPTLFHDPTSEPSRAVHWFAVEAGLALDVRPVWLSRGEHLAPDFLAVNPCHQVPALVDGALRLAEASAILIHLAERASIAERWIGATPAARARTHQLLSWHHTQTRLRLTLDYFLPVLLRPVYRGVAAPPADAIEALRARGAEPLALLDGFLAGGDYLGGDAPSLADLFIAPDLYALDLDPRLEEWLAPAPRVAAWLARLRERPGYVASHAAWNAVLPRLRAIAGEPLAPRTPAWVADACAPHVPRATG